MNIKIRDKYRVKTKQLYTGKTVAIKPPLISPGY